MLSDRNPLIRPVAALSQNAREHRTAVAADHPLRQIERLWSSAIEQSVDFFRDFRDACYETAFLGLYVSPYSAYVGRDYSFERTRKDPNELRFLPEVQAHLLSIDRSGYAEATIRMLILLAAARGSVRRDRLQRSSRMLTMDEPFASMGAAARAAVIHEQTIIVEFERERAIEALPKLLSDTESRRRALAAVEEVAGPLEEMEPHTIQTIQTFRRILDLSPTVVAAE